MFLDETFDCRQSDIFICFWIPEQVQVHSSERSEEGFKGHVLPDAVFLVGNNLWVSVHPVEHRIKDGIE